MPRTKYFNFLYEECKRKAIGNVNVSEIMDFMRSKEGQEGFKNFCRLHQLESKNVVQSTSQKAVDAARRYV